MESFSPGNRHHDRLVKFKVYEEVGVPKFWLMDPMERSVTIYVLNDEGRFAELNRGGEGDTVRSHEIGGSACKWRICSRRLGSSPLRAGRRL